MRLCKKCIGTLNLDNTDIYLEQKADDESPSSCPVCGSTESFVNIDDIIAPIITALWEKGYNTVACCGGHQPSNKLLPGHYHKMYITFDLENCAHPSEFAESLIEFCKRNPTAYLRADPTGKYCKADSKLFHLGLYIIAKTYNEHLKNIVSLMAFVQKLSFNKINNNGDMPEGTVMSFYLKLFGYEKFFYDVVVNDHGDVRLLSFNFTGLYIVNLTIEMTLMRVNPQGSPKSGRNIYGYEEIITTIMKEHPINELLNENAKEPDQYVPSVQFFTQCVDWLGHSDQIISFSQE